MNHDNAAEVLKEERIQLSKLPFTLDDLKQPDENTQHNLYEEEAAGKPFIEREDGINEVNAVQLGSSLHGISVDALLQSR